MRQQQLFNHELRCVFSIGTQRLQRIQAASRVEVVGRQFTYDENKIAAASQAALKQEPESLGRETISFSGADFRLGQWDFLRRAAPNNLL